MSVEFRQRTPGEYGKMIMRRKWLILLPAIAVATAVAWVVYRLPNIYESTTLIVVKPSTLPTNVVPTMTEDSLSRQLTSIAQVVTSRSSLEPLVEKYDLYRAERQRGEPMEVIIGNMRSDIKVEVNTSRNDITNGFNITYQGREPRSVQAVTAELASKYINEQAQNTIASTASANKFFEQQVQQAKEALDEVDQQRLDFMQKNVGNLPSEVAALIGQLSGLRDQQKTYLTEVGRLQDRRTSLTTSLALVRKSTEQLKDEAIEATTDPKTTLGWAELVKRKADLEAQIQRMLTEYREKHPDVLAKQAELASVQKGMDQMVGEWEEKIKAKQDKLKDQPNLQVASLENEIKLIDGEIKRQQKAISDIDAAVAQVTARINSVPGAEVALGALEREYETKKSAYDALRVQQERIALGAEAASQQQGEGIQVIDPANLPSQPVAPRRFMLFAMGLGLGLGFGFLLAAAFEAPKLLTIQNREDAAHYTGLPVLVTVPELLTPNEARARPWRRRALLAAGIVATIVSIPLLAFVLRATHLFETFMSGRT